MSVLNEEFTEGLMSELNLWDFPSVQTSVTGVVFFSAKYSLCHKCQEKVHSNLRYLDKIQLFCWIWGILRFMWDSKLQRRMVQLWRRLTRWVLPMFLQALFSTTEVALQKQNHHYMKLQSIQSLHSHYIKLCQVSSTLNSSSWTMLIV